MLVVLGEKIVQTERIELITLFRDGRSAIAFSSGRTIDLESNETERLLQALGLDPSHVVAQAEEAWNDLERDADWGDPPAW